MNLNAQILVKNITIRMGDNPCAWIDYTFKIEKVEPHFMQHQKQSLSITEDMQTHIDALKKLVAESIEDIIREDEE